MKSTHHKEKNVMIFYNIEAKQYCLKKPITKRAKKRQSVEKYLQFIPQRVNCLNIQRALTN